MVKAFFVGILFTGCLNGFGQTNNITGPVNITSATSTVPLTVHQPSQGKGITIIQEDGSSANPPYSSHFLQISTEDGNPGIFKFNTDNSRMDFQSAGQIFFKTGQTFFQSDMAITRKGDPSSSDPHSKHSHTLPLESNIWNGTLPIPAGELYYAGLQNLAQDAPGVHRLAFFVGARYADFSGGGAEVMCINSDQTVGIGTVATAGYKLAVNGSAVFTKAVVKLYGSWPDYVFHKSYVLPSLQDIEQYIKQHSHLPDMPSAEDVEKNGIDVGGNQALLLKKIEELTIYMIEQDKLLKQQSQRIDQQAKDINLLKIRLDKKK